MISASRLRTFGLLAAGASAAAACTTSTTTTTYTPITGIEIQSAALVAGFGCGTEASQVYRYAAAVSYESGPDGGEAGAPVEQSGVPLTNIFDCFADGVFENLPSSDAGGLTFSVTIFAYTQAAYVGAGLPANLGCPPVQDGGLCIPGSEPVTPAQEKLATWATVCTATQQAGTPVIAVCGPLERVALPLGTGDASTDGSTDSSTDSSTDAAPEGATEAIPDAAMAVTPEASTDGGMASPDGNPSADGGTSNDG